MAIILGCLALAIAATPLIWGMLNDLEHERKLTHGEELATVHCAACHLKPAPDILPKRSWEAALGYMGYWLGMENVDYLADHPAFARENVTGRREVLLRENVLPSAPLLSESEWEVLRYYYVDTAPIDPLPQTGKPSLAWELPQFRLTESNYSPEVAVTTLVRIREARSEVYIGDSGENTLAVLDGDGFLKSDPRRFGLAMSPVDIEFVDDVAYIGSIGDLMANAASAAKPAHITTLGLVEQSIEGGAISVLINDLYRMADMEIVDLNGDGAMDFVVCGFGVLVGSVSWFESQADGSYEEHVIVSRPGAVKVESHDFNGDGFLDLAVLLSDAREGFYILINDGTNEFQSHTVFETHAAYGHTFFELEDFDNDGLMDLLVVNGDNVDSDTYNTPKNYQGLRIYLNRGDLRFDEAYFYPMYGAFGAQAADFDNDGDLDIAAISFYPDFSSEQRESFTYLQNDGGLNFSAYTSPELMGGRWMTMDVGDIDGDSDIDVVLGGGYIPVGMFAYMDMYEEFTQTGPPVLLLKNTLY